MDSLKSLMMDHSSHTDHSGHGSHGGESSMCNMSMLFTWDTTDLCVVFKWWHVRTNLGLLLTLITIVFLSASYEFIRYRIRLLDNEAIQSNAVGNAHVVSNKYRLKQSLGYAVQVGYSYLLMLVFMTYNGWAMVSVCVGAGIGFWLWGDKAQRSMSCH